MKHNFPFNSIALCFGIFLMLQVHSATAQTRGQVGEMPKEPLSQGHFTKVIDRKIPASDIFLLQKFIENSDQASAIQNDSSDIIYILDNDAFKGEIPVFKAFGKDVLILDKNALHAKNPNYFLTVDGYNKLDNSCEAIVNVHKNVSGQREIAQTQSQKLTKNGSTWSVRK